ncbi:hypothetical protein [Azotobacter beijerinckii]|uniref:hypothetical protein n=1 Tax=Azotobacter beijerinckii TaxID=170623 RepID=UPI0014289712|nr:hypothetical protein [Azotobacter beijerinckii]
MGDLQIPAKVSTQQQLQPVLLGRIAAIHGPQMADHKTCARAAKPKNGGGIGGFHAWALHAGTVARRTRPSEERSIHRCTHLTGFFPGDVKYGAGYR